MPRIHTHYDNLKVTRNAPPEVIRAAYKTLCQKFHPDRNPDKADATKTFLLIRTAYETLSDPEKRRLLKVNIEDAAKADGLFTLLMGDEVPPRRQFIEDNALNVQFLDV